MKHNFWLMACLLSGCILVMAIISSIPMYVNGVLQRMLIKDMETIQERVGQFPGDYTVSASSIIKDNYDVLEMDELINNKLLPSIKLPMLNKSSLLFTQYFSLESNHETKQIRSVQLTSTGNLEEYINVVAGRFYNRTEDAKSIEAVVPQTVFESYGLALDETYQLKSQVEGILPYTIKIVGVIEAKDPSDHYWISDMSSMRQSILIDHELFKDEFLKNTKQRYFDSGRWKASYDFSRISLGDLDHLVKTINQHSTIFEKRPGIANSAVLMTVLKEYNVRRKQLTATLWILLLPVFFIMIFYLYMVAQLIIKKDANEIAVYKSRGATKGQIQFKYLIESSLLVGIALIVGIPLGYYFCSLIGATDGFLSFVNRKALVLRLEVESIIYCFIAGFIMIATIMIPAYKVSKTTIVTHKQRSNKKNKRPMWKSFFLDFILLAVAFYGVYQYNSQQEVMEIYGGGSEAFQIDPLIFFTATLFTLGAGLLFLRVYPYIIKLFFSIIKKKCSPSLYMCFAQVSRSKGQEQFIMLFMVLVMAIGIYSANAARTINQNIEDKINYMNGSHLKIREQWYMPDYAEESGIDLESTNSKVEDLWYDEPPIYRYKELEGVEEVTKVYSNTKTTAKVNDKGLSGVYLMGIIPHEFGQVVWFRNDLLPYHINDYLNVLTSYPEAALISSNMASEYNIDLGDRISLQIKDVWVNCIVSGFVPYWPTYNPYGQSSGEGKHLVVVNNSYLFSNLRQLPYDVWIKKEVGALEGPIYNGIQTGDFDINQISSATQSIIKKKNGPLLQGMNGALTVAFLSTMIICFMGYLIYWIIAIKERTLYFGTIRALGLSKKKVTSMIIYEQLFTCGLALIAGVFIGGIVSDIFVPLLQIVFSTKEQVQPFLVIFNGDDYVKVYFIIAMMLIVGVSMLAKIISRLNIGQALKLGED